MRSEKNKQRRQGGRDTARGQWLIGCVSMLLLVSLVGCGGVEKRPDIQPTSTAPEEGVSFAPEAEDVELETGVPERPQESEPEDELSEAVRGTLRSALSAMEGGDYESATSTLKSLAGDEKAGGLANYNLGVLADRRGKPEEAKGYFEESLRVEPDFSASLVSLVRIYLRQGKVSAALQTADRYIVKRPENMNHVEARLLALLSQEKYEDVLSEAKQVLRSDEKNTRAMIVMAGAYYSLGKHELSEDILQQVLKIGVAPYLEAEVHYRMGFVRLAMDSEGRAISSLQKAVDLRGDFAEARNNLGLLLHKARDYETAIMHFNEAIAVYPDFKEAHLNLGNSFKGKKAYEDAEKAFKRASSLNSSYADAYFNLGVLYLDAEFGDGRDKKAQLQQAIDNFNRYKSELKSSITKEDPADKYIEEAKKLIELEKKREEMRREMLKQAEEEPDFDEGEEGFDEEMEEDSEGEEEFDEEMEEDSEGVEEFDEEMEEDVEGEGEFEVAPEESGEK